MPKRFATIKREHADRLAVEDYYELEPEDRTEFRGFGTRWINRPESYLGVSFVEWERYIGRTIAFSELEGTGEGMIGGPTRTQVGGANSIWFYDGALCKSRMLTARWARKTADLEQDVRKEVERWSHLLQDDSYDLSPDIRQRIARMIEHGREFLEEQKKFVAAEQDEPSK